MGWQTTNPGGSYAQRTKLTCRLTQWGFDAWVSIARLSENQVSIKYELSPEYGTQGKDYFYPPNYWYLAAGSNTKTTYAFGQTGDRTVYWTGTLAAGASITAYVAGYNSGAIVSNSTRSAAKTGPAYTTTYTISYNANGGSGAPGSQTKTYGAALTLSSAVPARTGYSFLGWSTSSTATTATYAAGGSYTANASATLYAVWQLITYAVTFNGNGADGGATASQRKNYGQTLVLSANGFTRTNYTFLYWNTKADGTGTTYAAGANYTTNAALALYAIWKKNNIPVFINVDGTVHQVEKAYMNVGGEIKECTVYFNNGGTIYTLT